MSFQIGDLPTTSPVSGVSGTTTIPGTLSPTRPRPPVKVPAETSGGSLFFHGKRAEAGLVDWITKEVHWFPINPTVIEEEQEVNYANMEVIGVSPPPKQFTSGGPRRFTVELHFDRGVKGLRDMAIDYELGWYAQFRYPDRSNGFSLVKPPHPVVLYGIGSVADPVHSGVLCVITNMSITYDKWQPDYTLWRCKIKLVLEELVFLGWNAREWYAPLSPITVSTEDLVRDGLPDAGVEAQMLAARIAAPAAARANARGVHTLSTLKSSAEVAHARN